MSNQDSIQITVDGRLLEALIQYQLATIRFKSCMTQEDRESKRLEAYEKAAELAHCFSEEYSDLVMDESTRKS